VTDIQVGACVRVKRDAWPDGVGAVYNGRSGVVREVGWMLGRKFAVVTWGRADPGQPAHRRQNDVVLPVSHIDVLEQPEQVGQVGT
jgi:hypothetical protein